MVDREYVCRVMQANQGRTKPERALAQALWRRGLRYLTADGHRRSTARAFMESRTSSSPA